MRLLSQKKKLRSLLEVLKLDERISELLVKSCDVSKLRNETYEPQQWTLLHLAAATNSVPIVRHVLPADCGWRDSSKGPLYSLIHIAARTGHLDLLKFLIQRDSGRMKAILEQKSSDEATPLFAASKRGQADAVRLLLREGANVNVLADSTKIRANESMSDVTALHIAALGGHVEAVEILHDDKRRKFIKPRQTMAKARRRCILRSRTTIEAVNASSAPWGK